MTDEATNVRRVTYRGVEMAEGWPEQIRRAQGVNCYRIDGELLRRIPYGRERGGWGDSRMPCHDCAVQRGELHVPGCDMEQCPACRGQAIGCGCREQVEEEEEE